MTDATQNAKAPRAPDRAHLPLLPSGPGGFSEMPPHGGLPMSVGQRTQRPQSEAPSGLHHGSTEHGGEAISGAGAGTGNLSGGGIA